MRTLALFALLLAGAGCGKEPPRVSGPQRAAVLRNETLPPPYDRLRPLARPLDKPALGSWLSIHEEPGQSFAQYAPPPGIDGAIVLTRIGNVSPKQARALSLAS